MRAGVSAIIAYAGCPCGIVCARAAAYKTLVICIKVGGLVMVGSAYEVAETAVFACEIAMLTFKITPGTYALGNGRAVSPSMSQRSYHCLFRVLSAARADRPRVAFRACGFHFSAPRV